MPEGAMSRSQFKEFIKVMYNIIIIIYIYIYLLIKKSLMS
jgi:hypothetical protein